MQNKADNSFTANQTDKEEKNDSQNNRVFTLTQDQLSGETSSSQPVSPEESPLKVYRKARPSDRIKNFFSKGSSGPKMSWLLYFVMGLLALVIIGLGVNYLRLREKKPSVTPLPSRVKQVNGRRVDPQVYEDAVSFIRAQAAGLNNKELFKRVNQLLIERELLFEKAEEEGWEISDDEFDEAGNFLYGDHLEGYLAHPEAERRVKAQAIKTKIKNELVQWRAGDYIFIRFWGRRASNWEQEGRDPRAFAEQKINETWERLEAGGDFSLVKEALYNVPEVHELNENHNTKDFEYLTRDKSIYQDEVFAEKVLGLPIGEYSQPFMIQAENQGEWTDFAYVIVKVTDGNQGVGSSLEAWLEEALSEAEIEYD